MNHPLRGIEVETPTSEWLKGPALRPRFLSALSEGKTVATAVEIATEASPRFDVVSCLTLLDDARVVVVGIQEAA